MVNEDVSAVVQEVVGRHGKERDSLIPILNEINHELGYLPTEAIAEIGKSLKLPKSQVFSVATFYSMLSTEQRGRHVVKFCENAPCHVVGGREVWNRLLDELQVEQGGTSKNGKWTLETTSCIGLCSVAPVVIIDDDVYGNVTPDQLPKILARYL